MGEIAEDMVEGQSCSLCGVYFESPHGHPVVCKDCWQDLKPKDRKQYQKATQEPLG